MVSNNTCSVLHLQQMAHEIYVFDDVRLGSIWSVGANFTFAGDTTICTNTSAAESLIFGLNQDADVNWWDFWIQTGLVASLIVQVLVTNLGLAVHGLADPLSMHTIHQQLPDGVVLRPNEELLWTGRPYQGLLAFRGIDAFLVPFSFMWAGFALVWNIAVWSGDAPVAFKLFGLPFLCAGFMVTVGRFFLNKLARSKMSYVLTDQRAIIVKRNGRTIKEHRLAANSGFETSFRKDGSGTISFTSAASSFANLFDPSNALSFWGGPAVGDISFYRIDNVRHVVELLQNATYGEQDKVIAQPPPPMG